MGWFVTLKMGSKKWGGGSEKNRVFTIFVFQKEKRQPNLNSFRLQIASGKNVVKTLKN